MTRTTDPPPDPPTNSSAEPAPDASTAGGPLRLSPRRVVAALAVVAAALVAAGVAGRVAGSVAALPRGAEVLVARFDLDTEGNVPTWFSAALLLTAAGLLWAVAGAAPVRPRFARHWRVLAAGFVLLSLDEAAALHERTIKPLQAVLAAVGLTHGALLYAWVVPVAVLVAAAGVAYLPLVRAVPPRARRRIVAAGALYLSATLGMEMVSGWYESRHGRATLAFGLLTAAEEAAEMAAVILFIRALLLHLADSAGGCVRAWVGDPPTARPR